MTNETKQPTLPEAIALAREALTNCEGMIDELRDYPVTHDSIIEALAALDSLQVGEPSVSDSELAQRILTVLGYATEPSMEPGADERRDRIAEIIASNAAPCARCAELEATNRQLNREVISVGDEAEDYAGKLAALEAELKERDLQLRHLLCIIHRDGGHHTQAHGLEQSIEDAKEKFFDLRDLPDTIAQQAERIRILEEEDTDCHRWKDSAICMLAEQLAAAERDAELYRSCERACRDLPKGWEIQIGLEQDAGWVSLCNDEGDEVDFNADHERISQAVYSAIDAAIATIDAAQKENT